MRRRLPAQRRLWSWLSDCKPALVLAAVFGLLLALAALVVPLLLTVLVDHVLTRGQLAWGGVVVGLMAGLGVVTYLLTWLQLRTLRWLAVRIAVTRSDRFLTHLFRLPIRFFARRLAGDLLASLQLVDEIAGKVTGQLVTVGVDVVTCLAFLPTAGGRCCGRPVLWDVYLAAGDGVITAIGGPNGAGKSTLLKRVLDLVPRVSGSVTSYGKPYRQQRRLVAYVPQRERSIGASCRPASSSRARRSGRPGPTAACNARHPPRSIAPLEAIRQS